MSAISRAQRTKAEHFINEANKTLKKSTWFASSTEKKYEDAAELFEKAANAYKVGSLFKEAGKAYKDAGDIYQNNLQNVFEASKCFTGAGSCYKKVVPNEAIKVYRSAVTLLCDAGRLSQAAKLSKEIAEIFENEMGESSENITLAIESYEQAAELFGMEDSKSQASQCSAKVAELCSAALEKPDYLRAAHIYEALGTGCLDSNLLKYNAKGYFLQCIMCHLANGDAIAGAQSLQKFSGLDFTFSESREGKFSEQLVSCVENFDSDGFATACFEYDRVSKLDPWKTTLLVNVKRSIADEGGIGEGIDDDEEIDLT